MSTNSRKDDSMFTLSVVYVSLHIKQLFLFITEESKKCWNLTDYNKTNQKTEIRTSNTITFSNIRHLDFWTEIIQQKYNF